MNRAAIEPIHSSRGFGGNGVATPARKTSVDIGSANDTSRMRENEQNVLLVTRRLLEGMTPCGDIIINTARGWIAHETMGKSGSRMHLFMYEHLAGMKTRSAVKRGSAASLFAQSEHVILPYE